MTLNAERSTLNFPSRTQVVGVWFRVWGSVVCASDLVLRVTGRVSSPTRGRTRWFSGLATLDRSVLDVVVTGEILRTQETPVATVTVASDDVPVLIQGPFCEGTLHPPPTSFLPCQRRGIACAPFMKGRTVPHRRAVFLASVAGLFVPRRH